MNFSYAAWLVVASLLVISGYIALGDFTSVHEESYWKNQSPRMQHERALMLKAAKAEAAK